MAAHGSNRKAGQGLPATRLHLGCGTNVPDGWINVDYAPGAWFARIPGFRRLNRRCRFFGLDWSEKTVLRDLRKRFPWPDESVAAIYSSHTLEHFSREDGRRFLAECARVLTPGGLLRIVVPDLRVLVADYEAGDIPADRFVDRLGVKYEVRGNPIKQLLAPWVQCPHRCMYDEPSLIAALNEFGIASKARSPFDSEIEGIDRIELADRTQRSVIVEGRREG